MRDLGNSKNIASIFCLSDRDVSNANIGPHFFAECVDVETALKSRDSLNIGKTMSGLLERILNSKTGQNRDEKQQVPHSLNFWMNAFEKFFSRDSSGAAQLASASLIQVSKKLAFYEDIKIAVFGAVLLTAAKGAGESPSFLPRSIKDIETVMKWSAISYEKAHCAIMFDHAADVWARLLVRSSPYERYESAAGVKAWANTRRTDIKCVHDFVDQILCDARLDDNGRGLIVTDFDSDFTRIPEKVGSPMEEIVYTVRKLHVVKSSEPKLP
ncbi:MAG: hypothetical protein AUJ12_02530 [Alphaproteobacteria bacterium CG1_02_46_17]|nr:MAG: hypothetical protein AUJ12_02530 [Alphaproteobacteria bacterium CG1_02_46_17]